MLVWRPFVVLLLPLVTAWEDDNDELSSTHSSSRTRQIRYHVASDEASEEDASTRQPLLRRETIPRRREVILGDSSERSELDGDEGSAAEITDNDNYELPEEVLQDRGRFRESSEQFWDRPRRQWIKADCKYSPWSRWGECDSDGVGMQERKRYQVGPYHGGQACVEASTLETRACQQIRSGPVTKQAAVDCYFEAWSAWGACTKTCVEGGTYGYKTRDRGRVGPFHGGKACHGHTTDDGLCNNFPCPRDCQAEMWGSWSACSQSCSVSVLTSGFKSRSRTSLAATNGGKACSSDWEMQHCNTHLCGLDCYFEDWKLGPCSKACTPRGEEPGVRNKTRGKIGPVEGGKACTGPVELMEKCNTHSCRNDCTWTPWGDWDACTKTCLGGAKTRRRNKEEEHMSEDGRPCKGPTSMTQMCNGFGCPVDCTWTPWGAWHPCSRTCGKEGTRQRSRAFDPSPANGGRECKGSFMEWIHCNEFPCPQDCWMDEWMGWTMCTATCGNGTRFRTRLYKMEATNGGDACRGRTKEEEKCNLGKCPVNCRLDTWQDWLPCSDKCGEGKRVRKRRLVEHTKYNVDGCMEAQAILATDFNKTEDCPNLNPCPAPEPKNGARSPQGLLAQWLLMFAIMFWP